MARYIDADAFKQKLADKDIFFPALYANELNEMPTADVVPKSEVEELKAIIVDHKATECQWEEVYTNSKTEVAREIFEELENVLKIVVIPCVNEDGCITPLRASYWSIDPNDYAELKKKYTEEQS